MNPTKFKERKTALKAANPIPEPLIQIKDSERKEKDCVICKKPMLVAPGQTAKYHNKCRPLRVRKSYA